MFRVALLMVLCFRSLLAVTGQWDSFSYFPGMVTVYHPVTTTSQRAQEAFDRGLLGIYAFNYDDAFLSFQHASQEDPKLAMAYWGMALALDETLDKEDADLTRTKRTCDLCKQALALAKDATPNERAYIEALWKRFSEDPKADKKKLLVDYRDAMKQVAAAYPDDLDAVTLYAESMMDVLSWTLWNKNGTAEPGTEEIVTILESVLRSDQMHVGANHYHIHALEHSKTPQRALMSAFRLANMPLTAGHLMHAPSHIFIRMGDYDEVIACNAKAVEADEKYIKEYPQADFGYADACHCLWFMSRGYLWQERYEQALATAKKLSGILQQHLNHVPAMEFCIACPIEVELYFHHWDQILANDNPAPESGMVTAFWRYARARALVGKGDFESAHQERELFLKAKEKYFVEGKDKMALRMLDLSSYMLAASLEVAQQDYAQAVHMLKKAAEKQEMLEFMGWSYPVKQALGGVLLKQNKGAEAEAVFRMCLGNLANNGRSLFGLTEALRQQQKQHYWVEREARAALSHAPKPLTVDDLVP